MRYAAWPPAGLPRRRARGRGRPTRSSTRGPGGAARGADVVVGVLEDRGRAGLVRRLAGGLERVGAGPRLDVEGSSSRRRPAVVLVDDLADPSGRRTGLTSALSRAVEPHPRGRESTSSASDRRAGDRVTVRRGRAADRSTTRAVDDPRPGPPSGGPGPARRHRPAGAAHGGSPTAACTPRRRSTRPARPASARAVLGSLRELALTLARRRRRGPARRLGPQPRRGGRGERHEGRRTRPRRGLPGGPETERRPPPRDPDGARAALRRRAGRPSTSSPRRRRAAPARPRPAAGACAEDDRRPLRPGRRRAVRPGPRRGGPGRGGHPGRRRRGSSADPVGGWRGCGGSGPGIVAGRAGRVAAPGIDVHVVGESDGGPPAAVPTLAPRRGCRGPRRRRARRARVAPSGGCSPGSLLSPGIRVGLPGDSLVLLLGVVITALVGGLWPAVRRCRRRLDRSSTSSSSRRCGPSGSPRRHNVLTIVVFVVVAILVSAVVHRAAATSAEAARASAESRTLSAVTSRPSTVRMRSPRCSISSVQSFGMRSAALLERPPARLTTVACPVASSAAWANRRPDRTRPTSRSRAGRGRVLALSGSDPRRGRPPGPPGVRRPGPGPHRAREPRPRRRRGSATRGHRAAAGRPPRGGRS